MTKYHINPDTQMPNICRAKTTSSCPMRPPFGESEIPHFDSKEESKSYVEKQNASVYNTFAPSAKKILDENDARLQEMPFVWSGITKIDESGYLTPESEKYVNSKGLHCPLCDHEMTAKEVAILLNYTKTIVCSCGKENNMETTVVSIDKNNDSYPALVKENVTKMTWYHSTKNGEDFRKSLDEGTTKGLDAIHLGTQAASFERGITLGQSRDVKKSGPGKKDDFEKFYLYQIRIDESSEIQDEIEEDENDDYTLNKEDRPDVVRYYNRWEDSASVSVAVNPKKVKVVSVREVTREEAFSMPSPYNIKTD